MSLQDIKECLAARAEELSTKLRALKAEAGTKVEELNQRMKLQGAEASTKLKELTQRVKLQAEESCSKAKAKSSELYVEAREQVSRPWKYLMAKYQHIRQVWNDNYSFTFFFVPANGQNVAKTHIKRSQIKIALHAALAVLVLLVGGFGYMTHVTMVSKAQQKELAEYRQTKAEQEETIRQLRAMAEKNQKQLAALSKLEDQVRDHMAKNGAKLPPKSEAVKEAGKGGPMEGNKPSEMKVMMEQEKSIQSMAKASQANLKNLLNVIEVENERKAAMPSVWPTSDTYVTSSFGGRRNPFGGGRDWHPGIDIAGSYGNPVYASGSGQVTMAQWYYGYGKYIKISHGYGYETAYGHLSSIEVQPGQMVKKGQLIGRVGSTGYSTGPHLHFEVMLNGEQVNPNKLM